MIVRRTIDGSTVRYVERLHARAFTGLSDCWFVDCGGQYSGAATNRDRRRLAGRLHGRDPGRWRGRRTASRDGRAFSPARRHRGGRRSRSACRSLPISRRCRLPFQVDNAFGQGRYKNVNKAALRVYQSSGILVGPNDAKLTRVKARTSEPYGTPRP